MTIVIDAAPMSRNDIVKIAENVRNKLGLSHQPYFDVIRVLELVLDSKDLCSFEVWSYKDMPEAEGLTDPRGEFIALREDVYEAACDGNGRARFTAAHELGHWVLHKSMPLARRTANARVPVYRDPEWQANQFAVEILMGRSFVTPSDTERDIVIRHGVSSSAARNRIAHLYRDTRAPKR